MSRENRFHLVEINNSTREVDDVIVPTVRVCVEMDRSVADGTARALRLRLADSRSDLLADDARMMSGPIARALVEAGYGRQGGE